MESTETGDGHQHQAADGVSSVRAAAAGAETDGTDVESMEAVSEPEPSADVGQTEPVPESSPRYSEQADVDNDAAVNNMDSKETKREDDDADVVSPAVSGSPSQSVSAEDTFRMTPVQEDESERGHEDPGLKSVEEFEVKEENGEDEEKSSEEIPEDTHMDATYDHKDDIKSDDLDTAENIKEQDGTQQTSPHLSKLRISTVDDLDEMMDIGTVDQVEQEAQMKKEEEDSLDMDSSRSPTDSSRVSLPGDRNSVEDEADVKPTASDLMQSSSSPSSEAAMNAERDGSSPAVNGMKEVKLSIPRLDAEKLRAATESIKLSPSPPLAKVKDEPVDEEYDRALISSTCTSVKDEPTKEDLNIGSFYSVTPAAESQPSANASSLHMSCFNCKKNLLKGQTAFQRKGSPALFCSTACLTTSLPSVKGVSKVCHNCQKLIFRPQDVILSPDDKGIMKEFCSQNCLTTFNIKKSTSNNVTSAVSVKVPQGKSFCSICSRFCVSKHEVILSGAVHNMCSDTCFNRFRTVNNLAMAGCASCGSFRHSKPLMLKMEESSKTLCNTECLARFKEEALVKIFEDSSDSDQDYASDEEDLFIQGIDPAVDNLEDGGGDDSDDDDDYEPPVLFQPSKKRKLCPGVEDTDALAESSLPGPSSSAPPSPQRRRNSAPSALTLERGGSPPAQISATQRTDEEKVGESVKWLEMSDQDSQPTQHNFSPCQPSGPTISEKTAWTPFMLFKQFFSFTVTSTLVLNTNKMAQKMKAAGKKFTWTPLTTEEFYSFLAVLIFCGLVKCPTKEDYWRKKEPYNFCFPASVMSRNRFNSIFWCLHLSDPDEDEENEQKKGTPQHDRLFKLKPLYNDILAACKLLYHPDQQLSIDERMLTTKARLGFKQFLPLKPMKWGLKLFVLSDVHGYTWNYFIYEGKTSQRLSDGLGYSAVMRLLDLSALGTGYQVYMDNFYTSPKLLRDLNQREIMACGMIRESRKGFPDIKLNKLLKKAKHGEFRWLRVNGLLFIQWMDTKQVTVASNFHQAFSGYTAKRRVRDKDGVSRIDVPIPDAVKDYSAYRGGVNPSDALIGHYSVLHKTMKWYKKVFYHMVEIAVVNSHVIYKQLAVGRGETPVKQKSFRELLIKEMTTCKLSPTNRTERTTTTCGPIFPSQDATKGRRICVVCKNKTPVICRKCTTPLCIVPKRNCYIQWHDAQK